MDKTVRVCSVENEAEGNHLCSILDEQSIPYVLKKMEDRAYDGLYTSQGPWGFIESTNEYVDSIVQILKDLRESIPTNKDGSPAVVGRKRESVAWKAEVAVLVILIVAVVALIVRNVNLRREIKYYSSSALVTWKWMPAEKAMFGTMKATGQFRYKYYDRNYNNIYEEKQIISKDGKYITIYYNRKEDGYDEEYVLKDNSGNIVIEAYDTKNSGVFDLQKIYYGSDEYLELTSLDGARPDKLVVHTKGRERTIDVQKDLFAIAQP
jgi:hypothetical protein